MTTYSRISVESGRPAEGFSADMDANGFHDRETPFIVATLAASEACIDTCTFKNTNIPLVLEQSM